MKRLFSDECGMTIIELLIALLILAIGISAVVTGFSSGLLANDRAHHASAAAVIADGAMEGYRKGPWSTLAVGSTVGSTQTGTDNKTYWVGTTISWYCAVGTYDSVTSTCTATPPTNPIKLVSIEVRANASGCTTGSGASCGGKLYIREDSTFDPSTN